MTQQILQSFCGQSASGGYRQGISDATISRMMQYDGLLMAAVAAELGGALVGGRITKVRQHDLTDLTLVIRSRASDYRLFFSVDARFPRVYLTTSSLPVPERPPRFGALLRKHIQGAFIRSISQIGFDRVMQVLLEAPDGNRTKLVMEIMGKHSNLILISDAGRILGAAKHITASVSRYRQILPGLDYISPPSAGKANLLELSLQEFEELWQRAFGSRQPDRQDLQEFLISVLSGFGPFLAGEAAAAAIDPDPEAIWGVLVRIRDIVKKSRYEPVLVTRDGGAIEMVYPIPVSQIPPERQHRRTSISEALDALFRQDVRQSELEAERCKLEMSIKRAIGSREQALKSLGETIREGENAERLKRIGETILANLHSIEKGQAEAWVTDYYDPSLSKVQVELDPKLSPKENADRYFRRFQKARDGAEAAMERVEEIRAEIHALSKALEGLPGLDDVERIRWLRRTLIERDLLREEGQPAGVRKPEPEFGGARIRRVISADGWEILYGENSASNDYLTTKIAAPDDVWLHARSVTGAHVVIRTNKRPEMIPPGTLRQAAEIAAANSDARHSSLVPVDWTLRKHVRKPRGSPPGFVIYRGEKTLDVAGPAQSPRRSRSH